ncbi:NUDIX domain-containing protein [Atopobacter phocae]|uniref:NUDIX domain-containing protein n=1 Tax=Atopobacter phocae TaxID=136492 RepID=UPI0004AF14E2|nr:NUDIX hydrolase [Atopobacter phocae]
MDLTEWPLESITHDRQIARAIVFDEQGYFYFLKAERDDDFGNVTVIETAGGGVEPGETLEEAIQRELIEELGACVEIIRKIGVVSDYYNFIHRHNMNHYFLCRVQSIGPTQLTSNEKNHLHLSTLKLSYNEAIQMYEASRDSRLGRLLYNREMPVLKSVKGIFA